MRVEHCGQGVEVCGIGAEQEGHGRVSGDEEEEVDCRRTDSVCLGGRNVDEDIDRAGDG